ncbi:hypothetical protein QP168_01725 [Aerococcus urinae]|uniref:Uncharacterized protein n=1 Tax=Aerococcus mictus TaxID=2976810 RepID=A0A9Q4DBN0_9LACT|nr:MULTISPECIES: hypothetical protein [Aerococcus]MBU5610651.1 hypothetical protein [Aerococcus urinae]MCY3033754.1 hypothetical protein [Aerococcus mictus]MCY3063043.1 hypothetical protein [Aerococcus mictus]MCY3065057.1 hypothetical protein [Aerococcus mictus]MCY3066722.1 hypothetical protein [Aerococcus mictus]
MNKLALTLLSLAGLQLWDWRHSQVKAPCLSDQEKMDYSKGEESSKKNLINGGR